MIAKRLHLKNTTNPVLFTEGISDEYILDIAWKKLFDNAGRPFCIHGTFGRKFLYDLFARDDLKAYGHKRAFFALFDFDEAYDDWNGLWSKEKFEDAGLSVSPRPTVYC